jgi:hypothetical protein
MIHAVTRKEIPVLCQNKDCPKDRCLIKYRTESKYCENNKKEKTCEYKDKQT